MRTIPAPVSDYLSELTLGEPPRGWWCPDPIVRDIPPELCLLESLDTLTLIGCQVDVRLPQVDDLRPLGFAGQ